MFLNVLITRTRGISETIMTLPIAGAIRDRYPNAKISWAAQSETIPLVKHHESIDEVIALPDRWHHSFTSIREIRKELRSRQFNLVIDPQGTFDSSLLSKISQASRRIGPRLRRRPSWSRWSANEWVTPVFSHLTDRSLELLSPLDIHHPHVRWDLPIPEVARNWASGFRQKVGSHRLAIFAPIGHPPKMAWPADRYASTARYLADRYHYHSLVAWGTFDERLLAEDIVALSNGTASLAPDTTLLTSAALIETADLFVGGDGNFLHLAAAVRTPSIGLFGHTRASIRGAYQQTSLQMQEMARPKRRLPSPSFLSPVQAIGVEHVGAVADQIHSVATPAIARAA